MKVEGYGLRYNQITAYKRGKMKQLMILILLIVAGAIGLTIFWPGEFTEIENMVDQGRDTVEDVIDKGRDSIDEIKDVTEDTVESVKDTMGGVKDSMDNVKDAIKDIRE